MILLDENIPDSQRHLLRGWRIRVHQIGHEIGRSGMKDEEIIPLLHNLRTPTFFTRDLEFYRAAFCHPGYCIVCLDVGQYEVASFVRRILRHSNFRYRAQRMGKVMRASHPGIQVLEHHGTKRIDLFWMT
jgi:hypothetical protein